MLIHTFLGEKKKSHSCAPEETLAFIGFFLSSDSSMLNYYSSTLTGLDDFKVLSSKLGLGQIYLRSLS